MPAPNGVRYPLVGGTRQRHFDGTNLKPRRLLENAQTPTSRVHAVLAHFNVGAKQTDTLRLDSRGYRTVTRQGFTILHTELITVICRFSFHIVFANDFSSSPTKVYCILQLTLLF